MLPIKQTSLIDSLLLHLEKGKVTAKDRDDTLKKVIQIAQLLLIAARSSADAISEGEFRKFDALVGNFGCQITALEVYCSFKEQRDELRKEAAIIAKIADEKLRSAETFIKDSPPRPDGESDQSSYLKERCKLDLALTPSMAKLIRFRLLAIVNNNRPIVVDNNPRELPVTDCKQLQSLCPESKIVQKLSMNILKSLVAKQQVVASQDAAAFILSKASHLNSLGEPRGKLLERSLGEQFRRKSKTEIVSVPLIYNTETSLLAVEGVLLIKNKLFHCGKLIEGAQPSQLFLKMPSGELLSRDLIDEMAEDTPIYVVEGYLNDMEKLKRALGKDGGLIAIANRQTARLNQYGSGTSQEALGDSEADGEIERLRGEDNTASFFEIEHMFCSSLKEEIN